MALVHLLPNFSAFHADSGVPDDVFLAGWEGERLGHSGPVMLSNSGGFVVSKGPA